MYLLWCSLQKNRKFSLISFCLKFRFLRVFYRCNGGYIEICDLFIWSAVRWQTVRWQTARIKTVRSHEREVNWKKIYGLLNQLHSSKVWYLWLLVLSLLTEELKHRRGRPRKRLKLIIWLIEWRKISVHQEQVRAILFQKKKYNSKLPPLRFWWQLEQTKENL